MKYIALFLMFFTVSCGTEPDQIILAAEDAYIRAWVQNGQRDPSIIQVNKVYGTIIDSTYIAKDSIFFLWDSDTLLTATAYDLTITLKKDEKWYLKTIH